MRNAFAKELTALGEQDERIVLFVDCGLRVPKDSFPANLSDFAYQPLELFLRPGIGRKNPHRIM